MLEHGDGAWVWDVDGRRYLDLVGGIAVNALGHNHPALVAAVSKQAGQLVHVSNFFTSVPQVELAERLLSLAGAPAGSKVFFCNSGTEALEAAIKLARRTGRTGIVAAEGAFHGRTTGALALTHKPAYREPFEPLIPGVTHVPWGDVDALRAAVTEQTSALVLEPIQGEAGVRPGDPAYLQAAREVTREVGALLVLDEVQTGIGRTGTWFAFHQAGVVPDAMTLAKGLGGGVPIGALMTFGPEVSTMLTPGMHGSTFGGNPLACAAGLAVLDAIAGEGLLEHAREAGEHLQRRVAALDHPQVTGIRGAGLLQAVTLAGDHSAAVAALARDAGFIVNPVAPDAVRLAPPLVVTTAELDLFVDALPGLLDAATAATARHRSPSDHRLRHHQHQGRPMTLRHFLADDDLTAAEQRAVLDRALALKAEPYSDRCLEGPRTVSILFDKPTLRTQVSFVGAVAGLGGFPMVVDGRLAGVGERESVADVARILGPQSAAVVWRTFEQSALEEMAAYAGVPVVNALTDDYHPCQILADLLTVLEAKGGTAGLTFAYVGDGANNMAHSYLLGGALAGMHVRVGTPASHPPRADVVARAAGHRRRAGRFGARHRRPGRGGGRGRRRRHRHLGLDGARGRGRGAQGRRTARSQPFRVTQALMAQAAADAVFLHCLPAYRGHEVDAEVIDGPASLVWQEAENRLHAQKALLSWLVEQHATGEAR